MAYQLRQGYVRHGHEKGRVVTPEEFAHKLNQYIKTFPPVCFGTISLELNAIYQYGRLRRIQLETNKAQWVFVFTHAETNEQMSVTVPYMGISLTHDVEYAVEDDEKGLVTYPVFYVTAAERPREQPTTYYIAAENLVSNPLDCIAEFYLRAHDVGKGMKLPNRSCAT